MEQRKWLLVHNWCSVGWEYLNPQHLDSGQWVNESDGMRNEGLLKVEDKEEDW